MTAFEPADRFLRDAGDRCQLLLREIARRAADRERRVTSGVRRSLPGSYDGFANHAGDDEGAARPRGGVSLRPRYEAGLELSDLWDVDDLPLRAQAIALDAFWCQLDAHAERPAALRRLTIAPWIVDAALAGSHRATPRAEYIDGRRHLDGVDALAIHSWLPRKGSRRWRDEANGDVLDAVEQLEAACRRIKRLRARAKDRERAKVAHMHIDFAGEPEIR